MHKDPSNPMDRLFGAIQNVNEASERVDQYVKKSLPVSAMDSFREKCKTLDKDSLPWYLEYFEELEMYEHCAVVKETMELA